jgi:hypothetical protein
MTARNLYFFCCVVINTPSYPCYVVLANYLPNDVNGPLKNKMSKIITGNFVFVRMKECVCVI